MWPSSHQPQGHDSLAVALPELSELFASGLYIEILKVLSRGSLDAFVDAGLSANAERDLQRVFDCYLSGDARRTKRK